MRIAPELYRIEYAITTLKGHSGCPIITDNQIFALHNGAGVEDKEFNVGRLFTQDLL